MSATVKTWLEIVEEELGGFFQSEEIYNSFHTGCTGLCMWPKQKTAKSKTYVATHILFETAARWGSCTLNLVF